MRILAVYPDLGFHVNYPPGFGTICSVMINAGHEVEVLHFNEEIGRHFDEAWFLRKLQEFRPEVVTFSCTSHHFPYVERLALVVKAWSDVPTVVGGVHATIDAEDVLMTPGVDFVCRGEGDETVVDLLRALETGGELPSIRNVWMRRNGAIERAPLRPLQMDLDGLPFPNREIFPFQQILEKNGGWAGFSAGRGCPFKCTYCVNHYLHREYAETNNTKSHSRLRSASSVIREILEVSERYPVKIVNFNDDIFTRNRLWLEEFCESYPREVGLPFACNIRVTAFDRKIGELLQAAGCVELKVGIESGSERIRCEVLGRRTPEERIKEAFRVAHDLDIRTWAYSMVGIPEETPADIEETVRLNAEIRPYILRCSIFYPYIGTDIYERSRREGLLSEGGNSLSNYFEGSVLNMPTLSKAEILRAKTLFKWSVDARSSGEAAPLFQELVRVFHALPDNAWLSGEAVRLFEEVDLGVDHLLRALRWRHYTRRKHLDLDYSPRYDYELP